MAYKDIEQLKRKDPKMYQILVESGQLDAVINDKPAPAAVATPAPEAAASPEIPVTGSASDRPATPEQMAEINRLLKLLKQRGATPEPQAPTVRNPIRERPIDNRKTITKTVYEERPNVIGGIYKLTLTAAIAGPVLWNAYLLGTDPNGGWLDALGGAAAGLYFSCWALAIVLMAWYLVLGPVLRLLRVPQGECRNVTRQVKNPNYGKPIRNLMPKSYRSSGNDFLYVYDPERFKREPEPERGIVGWIKEHPFLTMAGAAGLAAWLSKK